MAAAWRYRAERRLRAVAWIGGIAAAVGVLMTIASVRDLARGIDAWRWELSASLILLVCGVVALVTAARGLPEARRRDRAALRRAGLDDLPYGAERGGGGIRIETRRGPRSLALISIVACLALATGALADRGLDGWPLALVLAAWVAPLAWVVRRYRTPAWILDAHGIGSPPWLARPLPWGAITGQRLAQRYYAASPVWSSLPFLVVVAPGAVHRRHRRKVHDELWIPLAQLQIGADDLASLIEGRGVPRSRRSAAP